MSDNNWYKAEYINKLELAFSLFPQLALSSEEFIVVAAILWLQKSQQTISVDSLSKQSKLSKDEINVILSQLTQKGFLQIKTRKNNVEFILDGLFKEEGEKLNDIDSNLFLLFEQEFGRVLSRNEMEMLADLDSRYQREKIIDALRYALIYEQRNMNYIAKILSNRSENKDEK